MIPQNNIKSNISIRLPLSFILFALIVFVAAQIILFLNSGELLVGHFRIPGVWMGAHFLLLGFAVMVAMGAMYQLVPVTFLTEIWNERFGVAQFIITAIGIASLSILLGTKPNYAVYGAMLTVVGIIMFIIQMVKTITTQKEKNILSYFVIAAIVSFLLTIIAGFLLAWNFAFGGIINHQTILYSHIVFGLAGWFTLLIFGFSYKLVPMFSLSHGFSMKWTKPAIVTYISGLAVLIVSFWLNVSFIENVGWILLFAGYTFFVLDIKEILAKRIKKKLDKPLRFSLFAIMIGWLTHLLSIPLSFVSNDFLWGWLIYLYVMGWIIFSILGYLYKIIPFLWWTFKYSEKIGKEKVPTMKEMIDEKLGGILFILFIISVGGIIFSALIQVGVALFIFQGVLTITSIIYVISIVRVLYI